MQPPMPRQPQRNDDRRAIIALFAVFALLVQALIPSAAMAAGPRLMPGDFICDSAGVHSAAADPSTGAQHKAQGGMPCPFCLAACLAFVDTPRLAIHPVAYEVGRIEHVASAIEIAPRARAPPRPPGQGPPTA